MDIWVIVLGGVSAACLPAAFQSWREREPTSDVLLLGLTGGGFGVGLIAAAAN
jgi:hypothetical protein